MKILVKPASDGLRVPLPDGRYLSKDGLLLERTPFVQWLIDQGDAVEVAPPKGAAPAPVPALAKEG